MDANDTVARTQSTEFEFEDGSRSLVKLKRYMADYVPEAVEGQGGEAPEVRAGRLRGHVGQGCHRGEAQT
eukprot:3520189-Lingulodinium_polyedra.AAC.1